MRSSKQNTKSIQRRAWQVQVQGEALPHCPTDRPTTSAYILIYTSSTPRSDRNYHEYHIGSLLSTAPRFRGSPSHPFNPHSDTLRFNPIHFYTTDVATRRTSVTLSLLLPRC